MKKGLKIFTKEILNYIYKINNNNKLFFNFGKRFIQ